METDFGYNYFFICLVLTYIFIFLNGSSGYKYKKFHLIAYMLVAWIPVCNIFPVIANAIIFVKNS